MSSFLCFICHNAINSDTTEETREKYREIVGMSLCPDSHLCYICCHMVNKLWLFKSVCLKRSLEYPVLFSEKCTINLHRSDIDNLILCSEDSCLPNHAAHVYFRCNNESGNQSNDYVELEDERNDSSFDEYITEKTKNCVFSEAFYSGGANLDAILTETIDNDATITGFENNLDSVHESLVNNDFMYNDDINFEVNKIVSDVDVKPEPFLENNDGILIQFENYVNQEKLVESETSNDSAKLKNEDQYTFVKTILSLEEQKAELESQRRSKKYLGAEFKCYNCALGFLFKDSYQAHMMRHEESNGEHVCAVCGLRFAAGRVLRAHAAGHAARLACARCGRVLRLRQRHSHARRCHARAAAAVCHLCAAACQDSKALQQHIKRVHMSKTSNRTYSCNVCGKTYHNQAAVRTHMIKHIQRKFTCDQCPANFSSPYTLNQHKKKHTESPEKREHMCVTCGVGYSSRKCLLAHMRNAMRHQEKTFDCPICSRVCPSQKSLSLHLTRVHSTSKDYACHRCSNKYTSRQSLARHIKEHTTPRIRYKVAQCDTCGKSFKSNSKLNRHIKEVCKKDTLEEELLSAYQEQQNAIL